MYHHVIDMYQLVIVLYELASVIQLVIFRPAWVPWTVLDRLLMELSENSNIPAFAKCLKR